jgi:hypothetical protein
MGLSVVQAIIPGMPNSYRFEADDDETEGIYPPFIIPLGSSGMITPAVLIFGPWIENDPRKNLLPLPSVV